jgi:hypothetical protein
MLIPVIEVRQRSGQSGDRRADCHPLRHAAVGAGYRLERVSRAECADGGPSVKWHATRCGGNRKTSRRLPLSSAVCRTRAPWWPPVTSACKGAALPSTGLSEQPARSQKPQHARTPPTSMTSATPCARSAATQHAQKLPQCLKRRRPRLRGQYTSPPAAPEPRRAASEQRRGIWGPD